MNSSISLQFHNQTQNQFYQYITQKISYAGMVICVETMVYCQKNVYSERQIHFQIQESKLAFDSLQKYFKNSIKHPSNKLGCIKQKITKDKYYFTH